MLWIICLETHFRPKFLVFGSQAERSKTFQHQVLSLLAFDFSSQNGAVSTTLWSSPAIKNRSLPEPRSKMALPLPISSHSLWNSFKMAGSEKTAYASQPRTATASSSGFGTHTSGLDSVRAPGRGRAPCCNAPGRPPPTSSSSNKSKHVGSTCALVVFSPRGAWCVPGHPLLGALW